MTLALTEGFNPKIEHGHPVPQFLEDLGVFEFNRLTPSAVREKIKTVLKLKNFEKRTYPVDDNRIESLVVGRPIQSESKETDQKEKGTLLIMPGFATNSVLASPLINYFSSKRSTIFLNHKRGTPSSKKHEALQALLSGDIYEKDTDGMDEIRELLSGKTYILSHSRGCKDSARALADADPEDIKSIKKLIMVNPAGMMGGSKNDNALKLGARFLSHTIDAAKENLLSISLIKWAIFFRYLIIGGLNSISEPIESLKSPKDVAGSCIVEDLLNIKKKGIETVAFHSEDDPVFLIKKMFEYATKADIPLMPLVDPQKNINGRKGGHHGVLTDKKYLHEINRFLELSDTEQ